MRALAIAVLAVLGTGAIAGAAAKEACVSGPDELALRTRVLQTELMVAALSCQQTPRYNAFILRHQKDLFRAHERLRGFFRKLRGRAGETQLNEFITRLANDSSKRSLKNVPQFCSEATRLYDIALADGGGSLNDLVVASEVTHLHGFPSCGNIVPLPKPKPAAIAGTP